MSALRCMLVRRVTPLALAMSVLFPINACDDHDPLGPIARRGIEKPNKALSGDLAVINPVDVNTAGEVIGTIVSPEGFNRAAISLGGVAYDLVTPHDSVVASYPAAINHRGQVIGDAFDGSADYNFLWTPDQDNGVTGTIRRLPDAPHGPAYAWDINDAGEIVGANPSPIVLWIGSEVFELPPPITGGAVYSASINQFGQVAGTAADVNGVRHAFLWTPNSQGGTTGSYVLIDVADAMETSFAGLNDFGQVLVTGSDSVARLWTPFSPNGTTGSFTSISGPFGPLTGADINNHGDVLVNGDGTPTQRCATMHPYVWRPAAPNGTLGRLTDASPGIGVFDWPCEAWGKFLGDEESSSVQVFGYDGGGDDRLWWITQLDAPLVADLSVISQHGPANEGIVLWFYGGNSKPSGVALNYQWDFGDGSSGTGSSLIHAYADNGQYTVTLTISDGSGASNSATTSVTIANVAPTGAFSVSPMTPSEGGSYVLTIGSLSDATGDLPSLQAELDCGDGRGLQPVGSGSTGGSLTCAAPNDQTRTARAQLRDKDGGVTEYASPVWIQDVAPMVSVLSAAASVTEQDPYSVSFKFTDPGTLDRWSYVVNWGDGTMTPRTSISTQGETISASHRYNVVRRGGATSTSYLVTVSVSDNAGAVGSASSTVMVTTK